jgi:CheY-like chemotaxis protein
VPKTLLAVDDSATMRKVLEITFGGEDFRVVTADGASSALSRLGEDPVAAVIDTTLGSEDGYALAKEMRSRDSRLAVVIMASRYSPYDANRGRDAGVDDYIDKPFDTQALIEKVKKALTTRETREAAKPAAPPPAPAAAFAQPHSPRPPASPPAAPSAAAKAAWPAQRTHTLSFEGGVPVAPPPPAARAVPAAAPHVAAAPPPPAPAQPPVAPVTTTAVPRGPVAAPPPAPAHAAPPPPPAAVAAVSAAANGQLAGKLGELGLTPQQAQAVLALSREVVERVVWEVVPQLAEVMIREEIARLTKEG